MTQKEKNLLLKDLCARLPYGVKVRYKYYPIDITGKFATSIRLADDKLALSSKLHKEGDWYPIEEAGEILIKPYLFPMSNMTEEQFKEYWELEHSGDMEHLSIPALDWLNKNHFDYRGIIPMGLAIDATGLNIY